MSRNGKTDPARRALPTDPREAGRRAERRGVSGWIERVSLRTSEWAGSSWAFIFAAGIVVTWALSGPMFRFSDTWQLVINTGTTIVTFLMVFLIQRAQNKDSKAVQLKLNEIVAAIGGASNRLIDVESLSEKDIAILHDHYFRLAQLAARESDPARSHSIEEAERRHRRKESAHDDMGDAP